MIFFFKKSKLIVNAFISENYSAVFNTAPINYSHHFYPKWWKEMPKAKFDFNEMTANVNVKTCSGIIELYNRSITIPMWTDFALKIDDLGNWTYQYSDLESKLQTHSLSQRGNFKTEYVHFKHISPWLIQSEKDVYFNFVPDYYNLDDLDVDFLSGVVEYYHQHGSNINFMVRKGYKEIMMSYGQPLIQIFPLCEKEIELRTHMVSYNELISMGQKSRKVNFVNNYQKLKKCPLGFGK